MPRRTDECLGPHLRRISPIRIALPRHNRAADLANLAYEIRRRDKHLCDRNKNVLLWAVIRAVPDGAGKQEDHESFSYTILPFR